MKKNIFFLLILFGYGCSDTASDFKKLKPPILLVGKSGEGAVTVCDSTNKYLTLGNEYYLAKTLSSSYSRGDTIVFFRKK